MGGTKINQDQIKDLSSDISTFESIDDSLEGRISLDESTDSSIEHSLESKISQEESQSESADSSINSRISDNELIIESFKSSFLELGIPRDIFIYQDGLSIYSSLPTIYPGLGTPEITYQWRISEDGGASYSDIEGENLSFYTPTMDGTYQLRVSFSTVYGSAAVESSGLGFDFPDPPPGGG